MTDLLYYHFIEIIKGPGTSFQSPALSKNMLEMFVIRCTYLGSERNKQKCNFHYAEMYMMTSHNWKYVDFTKTQKSRYLENETFFLSIKKIN